MERFVDIETSDRKASIEFFDQFLDPSAVVTSEVECTRARERAKAYGMSFFLYYSHAIAAAINEIPEFTYRLSESGDLYQYDPIHVQAAIRTSDTGTYNTLVFDYDPNLLEFARNAQHQIDTHQHTPDPFGGDQGSPVSNRQDVVLISALPGLSFTSITFTQRSQHESKPITAVGKMIPRGQEQYIPIAIKTHHGLVDAHHLEQFYNKVTDNLRK
jgi:chloramphenicol O-acetyltransferase type A